MGGKAFIGDKFIPPPPIFILSGLGSANSNAWSPDEVLLLDAFAEEDLLELFSSAISFEAAA